MKNKCRGKKTPMTKNYCMHFSWKDKGEGKEKIAKPG